MHNSYNLILAEDYSGITVCNRFAKRCADIIISVALLVLLSPYLLVVAAIVKIDSPGPVIFKQWRYGYQKKLFVIYKFRSIRHTFCKDKGGEQVCGQDQRLTRLGHYLRSRSIDELPQLWNIIKGDMSLVGPRPHAVEHHEHYCMLIPGYERRLDVIPGLTGLAQISGCRGATPDVQDMYARFQLDRLYATRQTFRLDLKILYLTFRCRAWREKTV